MCLCEFLNKFHNSFLPRYLVVPYVYSLMYHSRRHIVFISKCHHLNTIPTRKYSEQSTRRHYVGSTKYFFPSRSLFLSSFNLYIYFFIHTFFFPVSWCSLAVFTARSFNKRIECTCLWIFLLFLYLFLLPFYTALHI